VFGAENSEALGIGDYGATSSGQVSLGVRR
jgi:hypothetical protein